jgi:flagellar biosynthesis/type III secretory pathway protein FliH
LSSRASKPRVATALAPVDVRILDSSLDEFGGELRARREQVLRDEGQAQAIAGALTLFEEAQASLEEYRKSLLDSLAETAATLAVEMAQVVLCKELAEGQYDLATIVRETLAAAGSSMGPMTIHVHPDDAETLKDVRFRSGTTVHADPSLRRGNVQVETDGGLLVRDVDDCVAAMGENLREALNQC